MDQTLSLNWTRGRANACRIAYRWALAVALGLYALAGIVTVISPAAMSAIVGLAPVSPSGWARAWGMLLLVAAVLYLPGVLDPVRFRWGNVVGIVARLLLALLYLLLGGGFLWFALAEAVLALLLGFLYFRLFTAELMSRP